MFRLASILLVCTLIAAVIGFGDLAPRAAQIVQAIFLVLLLAFLGSLILAGSRNRKH